MKLFGFNISRNSEEPESFVEPAGGAGSAEISGVIGGHQGIYVDLEGSVSTEAEMVQRYRSMMRQPEVQHAVDEIVNESVYVSEEDVPVQIVLDDVELPEGVKKRIIEEFDECLKLLNFRDEAYDIFSKWYVDGRLNYNVIIDKNNTSKGIIELRYIDPRKIKRVREYEYKELHNNGGINNAKVKVIKNEYYIYSEKGFNNTNFVNQHESIEGLRIAKDSIIYTHSGLMDENNKIVLSHLDKAFKPLNQLRIMEDAVVIYRVSRAPERRAFYIDVGNLPKAKAEQYLRDMMVRHKNKVVYDAISGNIRDDRNVMTMTDDYWLPRREGGRGTEISTIAGGQNLGELQDVEYFQKRLYRSLNVPVSRLEQETTFGFGRQNEITREEIKFAKFIIRLRAKFAALFNEILSRQLILKGVIKTEEWDDIEGDIRYDFIKDNHFEELKSIEVIQSRLQLLRDIAEYDGTYFSKNWIRKEVLRQTDEEIDIMKKEIDEERESEPAPEEDNLGF